MDFISAPTSLLYTKNSVKRQVTIDACLRLVILVVGKSIRGNEENTLFGAYRSLRLLCSRPFEFSKGLKSAQHTYDWNMVELSQKQKVVFDQKNSEIVPFLIFIAK